MKKTTKTNLKRWITSTVITFTTSFAIVVLPEVSGLTMESIKSGALTGVLFVGVRSGVKALLEAYIAWYQAK